MSLTLSEKYLKNKLVAQMKFLVLDVVSMTTTTWKILQHVVVVLVYISTQKVFLNLRFFNVAQKW